MAAMPVSEPADCRAETPARDQRAYPDRFRAGQPAATPGLHIREVPGPSRHTSPNRWVLVDRAWAQHLGIHRTAGKYWIRSHELTRMLAPTETHAGRRLRSVEPR